MGHERVGALPKSRQWREIVGGIAATRSNATMVDSVASETLRLVKRQFRLLQSDSAVRSAFGFLIDLSIAARDGTVSAFARKDSPDQVTPLSLAMEARRQIKPSGISPEYTTLARDAAIDAIGRWYSEARSAQPESLFEEDGLGANPWSGLGSAGGFSELSRHFFASFADRYLNYFLEREVASALTTIQDRQEFKQQLRDHIDDVSRHAFESAKITQSFAAAWFNKNASRGHPRRKEIEGFVAHAMGKMRDEFNREGGF
jgi:hypothetical protein